MVNDESSAPSAPKKGHDYGIAKDDKSFQNLGTAYSFNPRSDYSFHPNVVNVQTIIQFYKWMERIGKIEKSGPAWKRMEQLRDKGFNNKTRF